MGESGMGESIREWVSPGKLGLEILLDYFIGEFYYAIDRIV